MAKKNLKEFRHAISVLKKRGILPKSIDARTARPNQANKLGPRGGKYTLAEFVKKHSASVSEYEQSHQKPPAKIETLELDVPYHRIKDYLKNIAGDADRINKMKRSREYFAFKFFGHQSYALYSDIDALIEDLEKYEAVEQAMNKRSAKDMNEIVQNLSIVRVPRPSMWRQDKPKPTSKSAGRYKRRKSKLKKAPAWKQEQERAANAQRQREYRARMTKAEKAEYNAAGRARAAKSKKKK